MTPFIVIGGAIVLTTLSAFMVFNRLIKLRNRVEAAWADLDVQLTRRRRLIPNLVAVVRGYAEHERRLLEDVVAARAGADVAAARAAGDAASDRGGVADAEDALGKRAGQMLLLAESYPDLKADERFRDLSDELVATENKIAFSRQLYNDTVDAYATATQSVPGVLLAKPLGFQAPDFFAAEPATRHAPLV